MIKIIRNEKGLTIVECIMALLLTTITIVSLVSMQSLSWTSVGKSDLLGRAQGILSRELETRECELMTGTGLGALLGANLPANVTSCLDQNGNSLTCGLGGVTYTVYDLVQDNSANVPRTKRLYVNVKWPGVKNGIKSSILVSPQMNF